MYAWLGNVVIGLNIFTGPVGDQETTESSFAHLPSAEGKPVLQDMGDELNAKQLHFFFDETFCDPQGEIAKLETARAARSSMPWVAGDGTYTGAAYVIVKIHVGTKKTTPGGRITRAEVTLELTESPMPDLASAAIGAAIAGASALTSNAALNVMVRNG